jgi:hypothetical protein
VALLVTLGVVAAACTTTAVPRRAAIPDVLGQQKGTPAATGQPAPAGTGQLDDVSCADATRCWAVGAPAQESATGTTTSSSTVSSNVIEATADAGRTWVAQPVGLTPTPTLTAISCPTTTLCMAVGLSGAGSEGIVLTMHGAGGTWTQAASPAGAVVITSVECSGPGDCTVIASDGTTFWSVRSSDFGESWQREGSLPAGLEDAGNLACVTGAACLVTGFTATTAGHGQGAIAISTDAGATWTATDLPAGTGLVQGAVCTTISSCLAVGTTSTTVGAVVPANGALLRSDDGGHTWVLSPATQPVEDIYGIACPAALVCAMVGTDWIGSPAVGTGGVAHSSDGGRVFTAATTAYTPLALTAVSCPTTQNCVAVGGDTVARITLPRTRPSQHVSGTATGTGVPLSSGEIRQHARAQELQVFKVGEIEHL